MKQNLPTYMSCEAVQRMLKLSRSAFYRAFPANENAARGIIDIASVADFLNKHAVNIGKPLHYPLPLLDETDVAPLLPVDGRPASENQVRRFCRRRLFPIPHYAFSKSVVRFPKGAVEWWQDPKTRSKPVGSRKFLPAEVC